MAPALNPRFTASGQGEITIDSRAVPFAFRRSTRAKYARLEVRPGTGLTVVAPKGHTLGQIRRLIEAKATWILRTMAKYNGAQPARPDKDVSTRTVPYLGRDLEVTVQQNRNGSASVSFVHNKLELSTGSSGTSPNAILERWYRLEATKLIGAMVTKVGARLGLAPKRVVIRGQKTRWGSCSHKGNISFNWKLIMAPQRVIEYVVIHEMAHLREMNHSDRFWGLVAAHCPRWREHRQWLKGHQAELGFTFVSQGPGCPAPGSVPPQRHSLSR